MKHLSSSSSLSIPSTSSKSTSLSLTPFFMYSPSHPLPSSWSPLIHGFMENGYCSLGKAALWKKYGGLKKKVCQRPYKRY